MVTKTAAWYRIVVIAIAFTAVVILGVWGLQSPPSVAARSTGFDAVINDSARRMFDEGRRVFRYDTFGDEDFWGGTLRLHEAISQLSPRAVLGLGLKVDSQALNPATLSRLRQGRVNLDDPAVTLDLLRQNAVVGVTGFFAADGRLRSVGLQCAICHSTVDDSAGPGVGSRLDGWANRDLNPGAIIAATPCVGFIASLVGKPVDEVRAALNSWGPGKFDAEFLLDGRSAPTLIPPAFGLAGVNQHAWTGAWGTVSYWNAFVANLELRGKGVFFDPRLDDASKFPVAAAHPELFGHKRDSVDLITGKLGPLHFYQLAIPAPVPPAGSFDAEAAERGDALFSGKARCSTCHMEPLFTEPGWNLHPGADVCIEETQARRAPDNVYKTSTLAGLWTHTKGGFFHDGRFTTLLDVVDHYDGCFSLGLTAEEKSDLVEYLKSLPEPD
jgi:hypothetical protein